MSEIDKEQQEIVEKVEKLLRLANKNPNEAEAAAATAKAQELLAAYNLDMAMVGEHGGGDGKREQAKLKGGAYLYQRILWQSVASLNFCLHWCDQRWVVYKVKRKGWDGVARMVDWQRLQWHHFMVGKKINVIATRTMAEYLEGVVERMVRKRLEDSYGNIPNTKLFSRWAVSYRLGAVERITDKIETRRSEILEEERRKQREAQRNGQGTSNALTLATLVDAEHDANMDFIYGEGWSAKRAAERAERARLAKEAEEEYTRWAAANPEEARKEEEKLRKEREKQEKRRARRNRKQSVSNIDQHAYWSGFDDAKDVSIEQQVNTKSAGLINGPNNGE